MLFDTCQVASIELPNRIVMAPMTRVRATDSGLPSDSAAGELAHGRSRCDTRGRERNASARSDVLRAVFATDTKEGALCELEQCSPKTI
jgi:hypothetical protein